MIVYGIHFYTYLSFFLISIFTVITYIRFIHNGVKKIVTYNICGKKSKIFTLIFYSSNNSILDNAFILIYYMKLI